MTVPGVNAETLSRLLDYLYTDEVLFTPDNVVEIHQAATTYNLARLQHLATVYIRDNVNTDNVLRFLLTANRVKATEIEKFLFKYFQTKERYTEVIRQPEISEIAMENKRTCQRRWPGRGRGEGCGRWLGTAALTCVCASHPASRRPRPRFAALYIAISQVLAQPADKYNVDLSSVRRARCPADRVRACPLALGSRPRAFCFLVVPAMRPLLLNRR